jgi:excisionase family DNA binding protein
MDENGRYKGAALSPREVAAALNLSLPTVYRRLADGQIPSVKIGGSIRVPPEVVRRLLDTERVPA